MAKGWNKPQGNGAKPKAVAKDEPIKNDSFEGMSDAKNVAGAGEGETPCSPSPIASASEEKPESYHDHMAAWDSKKEKEAVKAPEPVKPKGDVSKNADIPAKYRKFHN